MLKVGVAGGRSDRWTTPRPDTDEEAAKGEVGIIVLPILRSWHLYMGLGHDGSCALKRRINPPSQFVVYMIVVPASI